MAATDGFGIVYRSYPCGLAFSGGSVYVADTSSVRRVNPRTGGLSTPAGTGEAGPLGDGHPATRASFSAVCGAAVDRSGNLVLADPGADRIRMVATHSGTFYGRAMTAGDIYTVAGTGAAGSGGDGGPAVKARLHDPQQIAVDGAGNLVIADSGNFRIRVVAAHTGTFYGQPMTAGDIYPVAGTGKAGFSGDGGPAVAAKINFLAGVSVGSAGSLLITDPENRRVRMVAGTSGTFYGRPMTAGDIYTVAGDGNEGSSGDGGPATHAELIGPADAVADGAGNLVIADDAASRIRVVAARTGTFYQQAMTAGDIYTVAGGGSATGNGIPAIGAAIGPSALAVDGTGNLVLSSGGKVLVVAARTGTFYGQAMSTGDLYTVAGAAAGCCNGLPAIRGQLPATAAVAADGRGDMAATAANRVRVVPASTGTLFGQPMTAGDLYTIAGTGKGGFSGDGGPGTRATLSHPFGAAFDGAGNLVVSENGTSRIRVVAAASGTFYGQPMTAGDIYLLAGDGTAGFAGDGGPATSAELDGPVGVAVDGAGSVLIADQLNNRIRMVAARTGTFYGQPMTAGDIYTVAGDGSVGFEGDGGPATSAELSAPAGVAVDAAGNLVIADEANSRIRVVAARTGTFYGQAMTAGDIYTVAGGHDGFGGDGGPALGAAFDNAGGVAVDGAGNLLIADSFNDRVRVAAESTGTFYGKPMTAGDIYTVAGNGKEGFEGDGGPAAGAELNTPAAVAADGTGGLLIADTGNSRIREVTR